MADETTTPAEDSGEPTAPLEAVETPAAAEEVELDAKAEWYAAMTPEQAKAQAEVDAEVALSALYNK